jgi:hypothetical protein
VQWALLRIHCANTYNAFTPLGPTLHCGPPAYYEFSGAQQATSVTPLTASSGLTYAAWLWWDTGGENIADCRDQSSSTAFGQVFLPRGLSINSQKLDGTIGERNTYPRSRDKNPPKG